MGLVGFMNTLKLEGDKHGIKVNAIAPIAATRLTEDILPPDLLEKLKPEFVVPLVLYLCSDQCAETGMVFNAGMGCFNRAALVTGPGAVVGDGATPPTPEQIHQQWDAINTLESTAEFTGAAAALGAMLEALSPEQSAGKPGPRLSVKPVFDRIGEAFQADKAAGVHVIFQFRITGPGGGDWHVTIKDGTCTTAPGTHGKPTTTVIMCDEDFLSLVQGKLNAMQAYTSGKLKIEGDLMKSQLIEKVFKFQ
jgi:putative sterol carrier protein